MLPAGMVIELVKAPPLVAAKPFVVPDEFVARLIVVAVVRVTGLLL